MPDIDPSLALAEALCTLAEVAYGDPKAAWDSPEQLVRDALRAAAVRQITPEMVARALEWHANQNNVLTVAPQSEPVDVERLMDQWMVGILGAAFGVGGVAKQQPPLTLDDFAVQQYGAPNDTIILHLLVKGDEVAKVMLTLNANDQRSLAAGLLMTDQWNIEDKNERNRRWVEHVQAIFGEEAKPYLDRLKL